MPERNAIVIGAGIGGLATAAGLSRNGWRVTVFEQAPQLNAVGAGITSRPTRCAHWTGSAPVWHCGNAAWPPALRACAPRRADGY